MEVLKTRKNALIGKEKDNMMEINRGTSQGWVPRNEVTNWLAEVKSIKEKVDAVEKNFEERRNCWNGLLPNYYMRRKVSKKSLILIDQLEKLITDGTFENGVTMEPLPLAATTIPTTQIVGKTADLTLQEILKCILSTGKRIIGVHGMGGVGKTTIMSNINNQLTQLKHFDYIIWITVSKDSNVNKLQKKIMNKLVVNFKEDDDDVDIRSKISNALVQRKKFLLILDDLWDAVCLDQVGIPSPTERNGCKIVLTTRDMQVCGAMRAHAVKVKVLSEEESWELFKDNVGDVILSNQDIENLAKDVCKECCNLPLAVITVGKSMSTADNAAVWKDALKDLKEANPVKGMEEVIPILKFSYTRLCDPVLKSCFLYCSLYPEDHVISAEELINNWIWEGLIDRKGTTEDNINKGHTILDDLIKVSMLEKCSSPGNAIRVKMHDLIRDMAIIITRAENPRSEIYAGQQLKNVPIELPEDAVRISLMHNDIKELFGQPNCQHLLTLLLQVNPLQDIPDFYFNHMCCLRVLNLSRTKIKSLPESVSNLKSLHALILNGCTDLKEVPSLENFEELRVLDLSDTRIQELPSGVEAMVKLQCLRLNWTGELRVFPAGIIPRLPLLEELSMRGSRWEWSSKTGEGAGIDEILNCPRLTILNIQFQDVSNFIHHANSSKWKMMKRFSFFVGRPCNLVLRDAYSVEICGCDLIAEEENSLLLPDSTQELVFFNCQISSLWHFTRLLHKRELDSCVIMNCKKMKYLMAEEEPLLPGLKVLTIWDMLELPVLCKGIPSPDALKSLESLNLESCRKLKYGLPARLLLQLRCLKKITVANCEQIKEIIGEEEETENARDDGNNGMKEIVSQLQSLGIFNLPKLEGIFSRVLICNALETIIVHMCPRLKKLPFAVDNLPCALKKIKGQRKWWDALEWDHPQTKAHFEHHFEEL